MATDISPLNYERPMSASQSSDKGLLDMPYPAPVSLIAPPELSNMYQENSQKSPLLRLPAEIRDQIYYLALGDLWITIRDAWPDEGLRSAARPIPLPLLIPSGHGRGDNALQSHTADRRYNVFGLPLACRQLYAESRLLIYSLNIFNFPDVHAFGSFEHRLSDDWQPSDMDGRIIKCAIKRVTVPFKWADWVSEGSSLPFHFAFPEVQKIYVRADRVRSECDEEVWRGHLERVEREYAAKYEPNAPSFEVILLESE